MKIILTFLFFSFSAFVKAQLDVKIFAENNNNVIILYASNNEFCPISISLDLN